MRLRAILVSIFFYRSKISIESSSGQMDPSVIPETEGSVEKFLHIPYDKRWEFLKDTMIRIYFEEQNKIATVAKRMKEEYSFDAQ